MSKESKKLERIADSCGTGSSYIELVIKTVLNEVYYPGPHVEEGKEWPTCPAMSMVGRKRLENAAELAFKVINDRIPGDFIEAGIWKGGIIALLAAVLKVTGSTERQVYGADSFCGIPPAKPDLYPADKVHIGCDNLEILRDNSAEEVRGLLNRFGLLQSNVSLVEGWFEDTLDDIPSEHFALIRLDGDSYESTIQALRSLYPRLSEGGAIIIDDYYSWEGCRAAVDEWRVEHSIGDPLIDVDWTAVYWVKGGDQSPARLTEQKLFTKPTSEIETNEPDFLHAVSVGLTYSPHVIVESAWTGHLPFITALIGALRPARYVELGVHNGCSLFGVADAVKIFETNTECVAVDLWMGDPHAGEFSSEVYDNFQKNRIQHFPGIMVLRNSFESAVTHFEDSSIDVLHIDGFHTYDAVKSDFMTWLPKLANGGLVLFHDISELKDDFGVWKLWSELKEDYVTFEFEHSHGLGVLLKEGGTQRVKEVVDVFSNYGLRTRFRKSAEREERCRQLEVTKGQLHDMVYDRENICESLRQQLESLSQRLDGLSNSLSYRLGSRITGLLRGPYRFISKIFNCRSND